jgi:predicted RNA-binding Zn-ribbon protein involved in translation (DUF1610 family)
MPRLFGVFFLLCSAASAIYWLAGFLVRRYLGARGLHVWLPRLQLAFAASTGALIVTYSILAGSWIFALAGAAFTGLCIYYAVALVRVCESCGQLARSKTFGVLAQTCPKCGASLKRSPLFRHT